MDNRGRYNSSERPNWALTRIQEMLWHGRVRSPLRVELLFHKDSRLVTPADREKILACVRRRPEKAFVVTHGTFSLVETARYLGPRVRGKTVVLVGSMKPFLRTRPTDAHFNLGHALAVAQLQGPGVWVAMNGRVLPWHDVREHTPNRGRWYFGRRRGAAT